MWRSASRPGWKRTLWAAHPSPLLIFGEGMSRLLQLSQAQLFAFPSSEQSCLRPAAHGHGRLARTAAGLRSQKAVPAPRRNNGGSHKLPGSGAAERTDSSWIGRDRGACFFSEVIDARGRER